MVSTVKINSLPKATTLERDGLVDIEEGSILFNKNTLKIDFTPDGGPSPVWEEIGSGSDLDAHYGEMYFQGNAAETEIVSPVTGVKVNATYSDGLLADFTHVTGRLTYNGDTRTFSVNVSASITLDQLSDSIKLLIYKNGVIVDKAGISSFLGPVSPGDHSLAAQCLVELSGTDYIEIFVENIDSSNNIIVTNLNCIVNQLEVSGGGGSPAFPDYRVFSQITSAGVVNTLTEKTTIGSIVGSNVISASSVSVGENYEIIQTGSINTNSGSTPTLKFRVKLGGVLIAETQPTTIPDVAGLSGYTLRLDSMVFRSTGPTGVIQAEGSFSFLSTIDASASIQTSLRFIPTTINTTIDNAVEITAQWNELSANNSLTSEATNMKRTY